MRWKCFRVFQEAAPVLVRSTVDFHSSSTSEISSSSQAVAACGLAFCLVINNICHLYNWGWGARAAWSGRVVEYAGCDPLWTEALFL